MTENNEAEKWTKIHPALDFTSEHAYVGQEFGNNLRENGFVLMRDDGRVIPCLPDSLKAEAIELTHRLCTLEPRWSSSSIGKYSKSEATSPDKNQLYNNIKTQLSKYIEIGNDGFYDFLTLWTIGTYFFPLFNTFPYVNLQGLMQSGKTKLLTLCSCISFNSAFSANMSTACIYRLIQNGRCSLFIDEAEALSGLNRAEDFRNILLNGYRKGPKAFRNERDKDGNYRPTGFEVYGPKMLANIEGMEQVLASRCITIRMQRGSDTDVLNSEVPIDDTIWQQIRDDLYVFMMKNWKEVRQVYTKIQNNAELTGRDWELWKPIWSLAQFFDLNLLAEMSILSTETIAERESENADTPEHVLVEVLLEIVDEDGYYPLKLVKDFMAGYFDNERWLTERSVGRMLRRLGFTTWRRMAKGTEYFLEVKNVRDLAQRLGVITKAEASVDSADSEDEGTEEASEEEC
jgi:hypothetical protein